MVEEGSQLILSRVGHDFALWEETDWTPIVEGRSVDTVSPSTSLPGIGQLGIRGESIY